MSKSKQCRCGKCAACIEEIENTENAVQYFSEKIQELNEDLEKAKENYAFFKKKLEDIRLRG